MPRTSIQPGYRSDVFGSSYGVMSKIADDIASIGQLELGTTRREPASDARCKLPINWCRLCHRGASGAPGSGGRLSIATTFPASDHSPAE